MPIRTDETNAAGRRANLFGSYAEAVLEGDYFKRARAFRVIIFLTVGVFGFCQTQFFVSMFAPDRSEVIRSMEQARAVQREIGDAYRSRTGSEPARGIVVHPLFMENNQNQRRLSEALKQLLSDEGLNAQLAQAFGVTLRDVNAVLVPGWHARGVNGEMLGLTEAGLKEWVRLDTPAILAATIRDGVAGRPQATVDGVPRIMVHYGAFADERRLRFALLHELLHALNVPGRHVSPVSFLQGDLDYLPVYRRIMRGEGFRSPYTEYLVWFFLIIAPLAIAALDALGWLMAKRVGVTSKPAGAKRRRRRRA